MTRSVRKYVCGIVHMQVSLITVIRDLTTQESVTLASYRELLSATSSHEHAHSPTYVQQRHMGACVAIGDGKTAFNVASGRP